MGRRMYRVWHAAAPERIEARIRSSSPWGAAARYARAFDRPLPEEGTWIAAIRVVGREWDGTVRVAIDPIPPPCTGAAHRWADGGTPRPSGGGGLLYTDVCRRCGILRWHDTTNTADGTRYHRVWYDHGR